MSDTFKLNINTATDRANFVLHGAVQTAYCVGIGYVVHSPVIAGFAALTSFVLTVPRIIHIQKNIRNNIPPTPGDQLPEGSEDLPNTIVTLSKIMGMSRAPTLHIIDEPSAADEFNYSYFGEFHSKQRKTKHLIEKSVGKFANAFSMSSKTFNNILFSRLFLKLLNAEEEKAITAHEMAHMSAKHGTMTQVVGLPATMAIYMAAFNYLAKFFSSWQSFGILMMGGVAGYITQSGLEKAGLDKKNPKHKKFIQAATMLVNTGTVLGLAYREGKPEILAAWILSRATLTAVRAVSSHYDRCQEFQADRIAAEATQNPAALSSALGIMEKHNITVEPGLTERNYTTGPLILRPYKMAKAIFASHPPTSIRQARLRRMEKRMQKNRNPEPQFQYS